MNEIARQIMAICPEDLRAVGLDCVRRGLGLEQARVRILTEHRKRHPELNHIGKMMAATTDTQMLAGLCGE